MKERERVDCPMATFFDLSLVCAEHPMTRAVHLEDDDTAGAVGGLQLTQGLRKAGDGRKVCACEGYDI